MSNLKKPLSNVQLEILKAFSYDLNEEELSKFRDVIARFFAQKAMDSADEIWEKDEWSDKKVDDILQTKLRKSSK